MRMICFLSLDSQWQASQCLQIYVLRNTSDRGHPLFTDSLLSAKEITNVRVRFQSHLLQQGALQFNFTATVVLVLSWKPGASQRFSFVVCVISYTGMSYTDMPSPSLKILLTLLCLLKYHLLWKLSLTLPLKISCYFSWNPMAHSLFLYHIAPNIIPFSIVDPFL